MLINEILSTGQNSWPEFVALICKRHVRPTVQLLVTEKTKFSSKQVIKIRVLTEKLKIKNATKSQNKLNINKEKSEQKTKTSTNLFLSDC